MENEVHAIDANANHVDSDIICLLAFPAELDMLSFGILSLWIVEPFAMILSGILSGVFREGWIKKTTMFLLQWFSLHAIRVSYLHPFEHDCIRHIVLSFYFYA